ncbi:hypothetical protein QNL75_14995, partial [Pseudomonas amygdali pv. morsprunorum]|uniref:hypothetical protein n=1 Tax=Pseudomonas amygdali TaxID=47877 RepID=UPI0028919273
LGVEVHFFDFGVGSHHEVLAPEKNWEHSIKLQLPAGNVGFMRRLHFFDFGVGSHHEVLAPEKNWEHSIKLQLPAGNVGFMRRLPNIHQPILRD